MKNYNSFFDNMGLIMIVSVIVVVFLAFAKFSIIKSECEDAGEKKCITKALREVDGRGYNNSVEWNDFTH